MARPPNGSAVPRGAFSDDSTPPSEPGEATRGTWLERQLVGELRAMRSDLAGTVRGIRVEMRIFLVGLLALVAFAVAVLAESRGVDSGRAADAARVVLPGGP